MRGAFRQVTSLREGPPDGSPFDGVKKAHDLYLDDTTIGFKNDLDKYGFTFDNPNASRTCGCGSSFGV